MPKQVSDLIKKLKMEYPSLDEEPLLDEIEAAAYGDEEDPDMMMPDEAMPEDMPEDEEDELPELEDEEDLLSKYKK